jgi:hypothetical protein
MMKLGLIGAAAVLSAALATPVMAQEATKEPGMIGYNYPNSHYLTGGWGVHTPPSWTGRWPRVDYGYVAAPAYGYGYGYAPRYRYGYAPGVAVGVGPVGVGVGPAYDAYAYDPY